GRAQEGTEVLVPRRYCYGCGLLQSHPIEYGFRAEAVPRARLWGRVRSALAETTRDDQWEDIRTVVAASGPVNHDIWSTTARSSGPWKTPCQTLGPSFRIEEALRLYEVYFYIVRITNAIAY